MTTHFISGSPTQPEQGCGGESGGQGRFNPAKRESVRPLSRTRIQFWLAFALVVAGVLLIVAAFCVPPLGEIHPSVLGALGELLAFSGSILGLDYKYSSRHDP